MKKIDDFFAAGVIIGSVSSLFNNIASLIYIALGLNVRMPWNDMAGLFFRGPALNSFWAQFFGFLITFGVASTNGIIVGAVYKYTGRDFPYLKSLVICLGSISFAFMVLYPALGLRVEQYDIATTYSAFFNNVPFALITAFLFLRYTNIGIKKSKYKPERISKKYRFIRIPQCKPETEDKEIHLIKPKKLK